MSKFMFFIRMDAYECMVNKANIWFNLIYIFYFYIIFYWTSAWSIFLFDFSTGFSYFWLKGGIDAMSMLFRCFSETHLVNLLYTFSAVQASFMKNINLLGYLPWVPSYSWAWLHDVETFWFSLFYSTIGLNCCDFQLSCCSQWNSCI